MKRLAPLALVLVVGVAILAASCGGSQVPQGAIATVDGVPITKAQFDQYIAQARASSGQNGASPFPSVGTTTYKSAEASLVTYLVQQQVVLNAAKARRLTATAAEVQSQLQQMASEYGSMQLMYAAAKKDGMNPALLKTYVKNSLIGQKLEQQVIGKLQPTTQQMQAYYKANKTQFGQKASRTVRHILVKTKAEALKVRALLLANDTTANWFKVAQTYSLDAGTKDSGGNLGAITRGETVKPFDTAAFSLKLHTISMPIKSQYGWHILEVTAITPAKKSTFASAKANIDRTLTSQMQQTVWQSWLGKAVKAATIQYAAGYSPEQLSPSSGASPAPSPSST